MATATPRGAKKIKSGYARPALTKNNSELVSSPCEQRNEDA